MVIYQHQNSQRNLLQIAETVHIAQACQTRGVSILALKGPVLSQLLYGSPDQRFSKDLDFACRFEDRKAVTQILVSLGYQPEIDMDTLTPLKQAICSQADHHFKFSHPRKKVILELHVENIQRRYYLDLLIDELFQRSQTIAFLDTPIRTLSLMDYPLYLSAHGLLHSWLQLKRMLHMVKMEQLITEEQRNSLFEKAERCGQSRSVASGMILCHRFFQTPLFPWAETMMKTDPAIPRLVDYCTEQILDANPFARKSFAFFIKHQLPSRFSLKKGWDYVLKKFFFDSLNLSAFAHSRYPDILFPIYPLIRLITWAKSFMKRKIKDSANP